MNATRVAVAYSNEAAIRRNEPSANSNEEKRVRTIPNILRRRGSRSPDGESIDLPNEGPEFAAKHLETRFSGEFSETSNLVTANNTKHTNSAEKNCIRRKQEINMKDFSEDYRDWILCISSTPVDAVLQEANIAETLSSVSEDKTDRDDLPSMRQHSDYFTMNSSSQNLDYSKLNSSSQYSDYSKMNSLSQDSDYSTMNSSSQNSDCFKLNSSSQYSDYSKMNSSSQDSVSHEKSADVCQLGDDRQVSSSGQVSSLQSSAELSFTDNDDWLDIQSIVEVNVEPGGTEGTNSVPSKVNGKKFAKVSHRFKKEDTNVKNSTQINIPCCWICGKIYKRRSSLRHHQKRVHDFSNRMVEPSIVLTCNWCSKKYRRVSAYEKHLNNHLREDKKISP